MARLRSSIPSQSQHWEDVWVPEPHVLRSALDCRSRRSRWSRGGVLSWGERTRSITFCSGGLDPSHGDDE